MQPLFDHHLFHSQILEVEFPQQSNKDCINVEILETSSTWLLNVRMVTNSDLLALLRATQRPPIIGIALLACPFHTIRKNINLPELTVGQISKLTMKHKANQIPSSSVSPSPKGNINAAKVLWAIDDAGDEPYEPYMDDIDDRELRRRQRYSAIHNQRYRVCSLDDYCGSSYKILKGKVNAYLALPDFPSGLPVHIHGTFVLTDNRRSLWLSKEDTGECGRCVCDDGCRANTE